MARFFFHFSRPSFELNFFFDRRFPLTQLITEPTRTTDNTKTLIDHAVTNRPSQILDSGVIPCGIGDHDIIFVLRNSRLAKIINKKEPRVVNVGILRGLVLLILFVN